MSQGGGFCEKHGPYDPPHQECPYCLMERDQRRAFGPPPEQTVSPQPQHVSSPSLSKSGSSSQPRISPPPLAVVAPESEFVRHTVEPEAARANLTEMLPRRVPVEMDEEQPDAVEHSPLLAWLVVKKPAEQRGAVLPIQANQIIGREGDVRWDDPRLSRQHARLTVEPRADAPDEPPVFHLWPFGTTNPVYINGQEIRGATPLFENDEIRLGDTLFVFKVLTD